MFFVLSKVLWAVAAPTNGLLALALAGSASAVARRRWGARLALGAALALALCGALPVGRMLLRPLEDRFPRPVLDGTAPAGIIVLGGPIDPIVGAARGQVAVTDAATRLTEGIALARRFQDVPLVYTGGSNSLVAETGDEATDAARLWAALGVDPGRIVLERASRNTDENARFTAALLRPRAGQRWILVTSAYHMPRSVGLFRAAGFDVIPDPVDYRSTGTGRDLRPSADLAGGLARLDAAAREWVGLLAYRLSGKTTDLLPAP